ncbi:DsbA family protein [Salipiger aestuarii]|uniref:Protein-disulfide isomerase n=1 Tax=Salipiger aestuarii TaxID=568098 RepID=A0A327XRB2_9RHOB|nr:DsbA family protein [Salipiger aestuarii]KAA8608643.1 disulfide bond formation protein DsbA [Salipiger aestuarii]KAB2540633.1 disulfide bond formation protein DsbA [Salipiger aestuarii]RAK11638.1 protein-disulfide isomerase [Salipiger aestuarii]
MTLTRRALLAGSGAAGLGAALPLHAQGLTVEGVLRDPDAPVLGNPQGDVTLVEWFDYQCVFCKAMFPDLLALVAEDGGIRLVLKDWPIFGAASLRASKIALGAHGLGMYQPVMAALMQTVGRLTDARVDRAVSGVVPADKALARYAQNRTTWDALLERNSQQAAGLGFAGTPGIAVETTIYDGALDKAALRDAVAMARRG